MNTHQDNLGYDERELCRYKVANPDDTFCKGCLGFRVNCKTRKGYEAEIDIAKPVGERDASLGLEEDVRVLLPAPETEIRMAEGCSFEMKSGDFLKERGRESW